MSSIPRDILQKMMYTLKEEEDKTDLENLAVLSRIGTKIASAVSSEEDADATSASSTALIDLGLRLNQATDHGALTEIILHNTSGYSILMAINDEYIVFGGLRAIYRIGYYLGYLRELARKLNRYISGDKETEMMLSLETGDLERIQEQKEIQVSKGILKPSLEQDKAALDDLLGFLDDWEKEGVEFEDLEASNEGGIVSIPKSIGLGIDKEIKATMIHETPQISESSIEEKDVRFKVYDDEVPPIPLDDYTPMEIEEDSVPKQPAPTPIEGFPPFTEKLTPSDFSLPSLDELPPPDFDTEFSASEYDTEFVLEEESEALGSVLKDLGWDEEED